MSFLRFSSQAAAPRPMATPAATKMRPVGDFLSRDSSLNSLFSAMSGVSSKYLTLIHYSWFVKS